ncbi:Protein of unknown function [Gryllus bimaculatus]|nr:Protein of unknown function [Gryllus bimaculatus]
MFCQYLYILRICSVMLMCIFHTTYDNSMFYPASEATKTDPTKQVRDQ